MNQATLPFGDPLALVRTPRARHDDPDTSKRAARAARSFQLTHADIILDVLRAAARPLNAYEIAGLSGGLLKNHVQVDRRTGELRAAGVIVVDGERDGCSCYRLTKWEPHATS